MSKSKQQQQQQETESQLPSTSTRISSNWKLDPSLLVTQNSNCVDPIQLAKHKMTLRRRGVQCQSSLNNATSASASEHEIILPLDSTYLPKEELRDNIKSQRNVSKKDKSATTTDDEECNRHHQASQNDKIFSIATYMALIVTFAALFGILCLCICNKSALLVSAQYSKFALNLNGNNHHHHHGNARAAQHLMNRQGGGSQSANSEPQQTDDANADMSPEAQMDQINDDRKWSKKSSIDRYDSGEQIRPPLLRQPTTLAPLKSMPQQASVNNQLNLQEAASQDSYMSPDEREQLSKSHDNHYEGKNGDSSNSASNDGFVPDIDGYDKPASNRWSQPLQDVAEQQPVMVKQNSLEYQPSRAELSTATSGRNTAAAPVEDDGDYEEENAEPVKKSKSNLVPEMRRGVATGSANHNHYRPSKAEERSMARNRAVKYSPVANEAAAANEEADPNDDYGGGSDDSQFIRKSQQDRSPAALNLAASHNQQLNRGLHPAGGGYSNEAQRANSEGGSQDEGFGPGPNEAYMAEKADVSKDQDGDESLYAPGEGAAGESNGLGGSEEAGEGRFDRRSMNPYQTGGGNGNQVNYGQVVRSKANLVDNGDPENDTEDGNDSAEDSGSSFAPSLKTEVKSRPLSTIPNINSNLSPRTSASALNPQSATFSQSSSPIITVPSPKLGGGKAAMPAATANQQSFHRQQVHNVRQPHQVNSLSATTQPNSYQRASLNAPYNPQNNPSHAGKYFIN